MFDEQLPPSSHQSRRQFLSGVGSLLAASAFSVSVAEDAAAQVTDGDDSPIQTVSSPDGSVSLFVDVTDGVVTYEVAHDGTTLIEDSELGFEFQNQDTFGSGLAVTGSERTEVDTTWTPVWDRYDEIEERYTELRLGVAESSGPERFGTLVFRVFDDGVGFRFVFGEPFGDQFVITSERTAYNFAGDYDSWWIPNNYNNFEVEYEETALSEVAGELDGTDFDGVHTPMTMRTDDGRYLAVHEADLTDYASLALTPSDAGDTAFESTLAPLPDGTKVSAAAPHVTPWRTVQVGTSAGDLIESNLVVNLNEDYDKDVFTQGVDWIEPQKFIGVWWLMITGRAQWEYTTNDDGTVTGNHGAQTGRAKQYMDFASEHDIPGVLVEGWNEGWSSYPDGGGTAFDFTEPYPDFDLAEVTSYGSSLDPLTQMTMHNETAGGFRNYESQLDAAFSLYDDLGIRTIKNGYVSDSGDLAGEGFNHHNQVLVNHHTLVAETAAANRQMLDMHEPIHPTGRRRTYPNLMTREGVKGQEYDSFGDVSPEHHVTFPFTRMLGGPVEYTPGIFDMDSGSGGIESTRAKQLAMYPTYFSGLQMAADLPSSYLADQPSTTSIGEVAQAEWGDIEGFSTAARWANAQGEQYVAIDPNSASPGATVSWTVEDTSEGEYEVHFRYASDAEENAVGPDTDRTATVLVNGSEAGQVTFPPTEYWNVWESVSTTVSLSGDEDEIALSLTSKDTGGFNLDSMAVTESGASMPTPETAPIRGETVDAFQFIEDVPAAGWDDTRVVDAEIGDYMVTARQKDDEWYLGAMTDEGGRAIDVPLSFLSPASDSNGQGPRNSNGNGNGNSGNGNGRAPNGPKYVAEIYADGIDAAYDENLSDVRVGEAIVTPRTTLLASMVGSGGTAVRFRRAQGQEINDLPEYERPEQDFDVHIGDEVFIQESFIQATGSNSGAFIGGTTVTLHVDGERVGTENVRFPPNAGDATYDFGYSIDTAGEYEVTVALPDGTVLASTTVTVKPPATVAELTDPSGDDDGPGEYTYPTADAFQSGAFDLESLTIEQTPSLHRFTFEVDNLYNAFGSSRNFSPQWFVLWLRDPTADSGATSSLGDIGANVDFEAPWQYRIEISGFSKSAVDASGAALTDADGDIVSLGEAVDVDAGTVTVSLDREAVGGADASDLELVAMVQSEDRGSLRPVAESADGYVFGGAKSGAVENAPLIMDLTTPEGVSQADALAYSADSRATVPFVSLD
ncbi:carbohydrate-binding protein [Haloarcula sp. CBA1130]|uniref:glycoside hydrolase family 97 catalytic domain-containing protein n=1 Tax=unclassified Haloarcula TaxID=2624677 RepID=UPI0012465772|nr:MULTISPECIES: glycoside hydrolase family 97 catalytic domain-containing protein [unclassified Haloarcula]KAA9399559.1 carbohydrate-binding protein [Haloarcula sp. CBA1129]KAA9401283.1 carbohydrate-binding protein [Haloarcula sp. CBA1130]